MTKLTFQLSSEYIQLNNLLKVLGLADTGGEAKHAILQGGVSVNGEVTDLIRKKLVAGDIVLYEETQVTILTS